jgi:hypothetical protein
VNTVDLEAAREIRMRVSGDGDAIEYIARAALLLRDIESAVTRCPLCDGDMPGGHRWQCDFADALDTLDGYSK